jgi:hypothetical protein
MIQKKREKTLLRRTIDREKQRKEKKERKKKKPKKTSTLQPRPRELVPPLAAICFLTASS